MAIIVTTDNPNKLLSEIKAAIDTGTVKTWRYDPDGDFIHSTDDVKAWLRPELQDNRIVFKILTVKGSVMLQSVYAVYHGRFIEMLLSRFDTLFSRAVITALPDHGDIIEG